MGLGDSIEVLLTVAGGLNPELLKHSQTSIGVAWQEASCQDDLNHPNCRHEAKSHRLKPESSSYYWHTVWELCMLSIQCDGEELEQNTWDLDDKTIKRNTMRIIRNHRGPNIEMY